jgi:hypothetical protein
VHKQIMSAVKRLSLLVTVSYIILRGHWFNVIVWNVHAPTEDKVGNVIM